LSDLILISNNRIDFFQAIELIRNSKVGTLYYTINQIPSNYLGHKLKLFV